MITLLTGDNSFELNRALEKLAQDYSDEITRADADDMQLDRFIELISGASLFSSKRMVIIRDLSANKSLWAVFIDYTERVSDDVQLILVEPMIDKRTAVYKRLQNVADVRVFASWGDRDSDKAESWVGVQAKQLGIKMNNKDVQQLVDRVGMNQWELYHALEKLAVLDHVDSDVIEEVIEAQTSENVFNLFDSALRGNTKRVSEMIRNLQRTQDAYMTFGLLSGQVFQLAALAVTNHATNEIASDIGGHPYALGKLAPHANKLGRNGVRKIMKIFAETDTRMKSTSTDPWILVEQALVKVSI